MKSVTNLFFVILLLNIGGMVYGQYIPIPIDYKLSNSELIVEGRVVAQQSYLGSDGEIYTENIIEIAHIYEGNTTEKELAIITMGGKIDGRTTVWSHLLSLSTNEYGVFFLNPTRHPINPKSEYKAYDVFSGSQGFYHFKQREIGYKAEATLDAYDDITEFYDKIGVSENQRNENPFTLYAGVNKDDCLVYKIEPVENNPAFSTNAIVYFDLFVKVNTGRYRLNQSELYLKYSTEWFYENMVSDAYLSFSQNGDFKATEYGLSISDYRPNVMRINLQAQTTSYQRLTEVNTAYKRIARVGIQLKAFSEELPLEEDYSVSNITNNYRTRTGYLKEFECVKVEDGRNCQMEITSITPLAAAGVGVQSANGITGVIEIVGDNFLDDEPEIGCNKPIDHHVRFNTIDGGWIIPLEGDYLAYTNTRIRVKVPTVGYKANCETLYSDDDINTAIACTGEVQVCRPHWFWGRCCGCSVKSDTELYVPFAARNTFQVNADGCRESVRVLLRDLDEEGGYTIRFHPDFKELSGALAAFKRALSTWRCETRVNFKIDEEGIPLGTPGNCIIRLSSLEIGLRGATSHTIIDCGENPNIDYSNTQGFSIRFNSNINWHTGTNMPNNLNWNDLNAGALEADLESTALHELGHAHLLQHTCNSPNVMISPGPTNFRRTLTNDDENGGNHLSLLGSGTNEPKCTGENMSLINLGDCDISPTIQVDGADVQVLVSPNPTTDKIYIELKDYEFNQPFRYELLDANGIVIQSKEGARSTTVLDISMNPIGIYYLVFRSRDNTIILIDKIVKTQ